MCGSAAVGCRKSEQKPEPQPQPQPAQTLSGDIARPAWAAPTQYDMTFSLTAVIQVGLKAQYPEIAADFVLNEDDMLAAFIGDECCGIAQTQEGLFFLYIASPSSVSVNGLSGETGLSSVSEAVSLLYWSAYYKNLFEAKDAFLFANDAHLGTVAEPLAPSFVVVK